MLSPEDELNHRYLLPFDTEHVTVVCPEASTEISFSGATPVACAERLRGRFIGGPSTPP